MTTRYAKNHQDPAKQTNLKLQKFKNALILSQIKEIQLFHYSATKTRLPKVTTLSRPFHYCSTKTRLPIVSHEFDYQN